MPPPTDDPTTELVNHLAQLLIAKKAYLSTAESCTGGLLAAACTAAAGSSQWFERGFITYSNAAKTELLGVPDTLIQTHGAVSEPVAGAMARGALAHSRATFAVSVTGIAGPTGGTTDKPVGTVCFGFASHAPQGHHLATSTQHFMGDRQAIRHAAVIFALSQLCKGF